MEKKPNGSFASKNALFLYRREQPFEPILDNVCISRHSIPTCLLRFSLFARRTVHAHPAWHAAYPTLSASKGQAQARQEYIDSGTDACRCSSNSALMHVQSCSLNTWPVHGP